MEDNKEICIGWYVNNSTELLRNEITRELRREEQFRREIRQMINNIIINSLNLPD